MKDTYSTKELQLIAYYGLTDLMKTLYAPVIYTLMVEKAFLDNDQGLYAESLRRCVKALNSGTIFRYTEEWDALIIL